MAGNYFDQFDRQSTGNYFDRFDKPADETTRAERIGKGLRDPIDGGAQLLTRMLPDGMVKAGNQLNNWIADKTGMVGRLPEGGVDQQVREAEAAYQQRRGTEGGSFDGMRVIGNVVNPTNLAIASLMPAAATMLRRAGVGAVGGAATSVLNPVTSGTTDEFWSEKRKEALAGTAGGAAVPFATGALGRAISPKASVNPEVQMLRREGVTPTIGQALGGRWNTVEEKLQSLPLMGDMISVARGKARDEFNNAAINRTVAPIGQKVNGSGQDAVRQAGDALSDVYEQAKGMLGAFRIDQQAAQELASVRSLAQNLPKPERNAINSYFKDYLNQGALTAETFKTLDSKLGKDIRRFSGSNDAYQKDVGDALQTIQKSILDNAKRANPQASALFDQADAGWARLVRVEGASKLAQNSSGVFTPGQLQSAVRASDSSARDRATARGTALMQDLSRAGQNVLGNKVPDSGTAGRVALGTVAAGSSLLDPTFLAAMLTGGAMYTGPGRGLLSGAVSARPQSAQAIADALRRASPGLIPLGSEVGLGLLN